MINCYFFYVFDVDQVFLKWFIFLFKEFHNFIKNYGVFFLWNFSCSLLSWESRVFVLLSWKLLSTNNCCCVFVVKFTSSCKFAWLLWQKFTYKNKPHQRPLHFPSGLNNDFHLTGCPSEVGFKLRCSIRYHWYAGNPNFVVKHFTIRARWSTAFGWCLFPWHLEGMADSSFSASWITFKSYLLQYANRLLSRRLVENNLDFEEFGWPSFKPMQSLGLFSSIKARTPTNFSLTPGINEKHELLAQEPSL